MNDEKLKMLSDQLAKLSEDIAKLEKIDPDALFAPSKTKRSTPNESRPIKPKANEKPDWIKEWNKKNASHGPVKKIVETVETFHEETGEFEVKTALLEPVVLPDHLKLGVLHEDRPQSVVWAEQPKFDGLLDPNLPLRQARKKLEENPGNPLTLRDEGPIKPVRKQMTRLNKVWKYRNFRKCGVCEEFDTWEARVDPYNKENVGIVHAEIWCHKCGATDFEVSDSMPNHIGSWIPPKETSKQAKDRAARQAYRRERTIFSLVQQPKTAMELNVWFREVEKYFVRTKDKHGDWIIVPATDVIMLELMLKRMASEGLVVCDKAGKWWEREDFIFENTKID
jgi:hypothetical protein